MSAFTVNKSTGMYQEMAQESGLDVLSAAISNIQAVMDRQDASQELISSLEGLKTFDKSKPPTTFSIPADPAERFILALSGTVCFGDEGKSRLSFSRGRRKAGRNTKYTIKMADGRVFRFTAASDEEAVVKANKRVAGAK